MNPASTQTLLSCGWSQCLSEGQPVFIDWEKNTRCEFANAVYILWKIAMISTLETFVSFWVFCLCLPILSLWNLLCARTRFLIWLCDFGLYQKMRTYFSVGPVFLFHCWEMAKTKYLVNSGVMVKNKYVCKGLLEKCFLQWRSGVFKINGRECSWFGEMKSRELKPQAEVVGASTCRLCFFLQQTVVFSGPGETVVWLVGKRGVIKRLVFTCLC